MCGGRSPRRCPLSINIPFPARITDKTLEAELARIAKQPASYSLDEWIF